MPNQLILQQQNSLMKNQQEYCMALAYKAQHDCMDLQKKFELGNQKLYFDAQKALQTMKVYRDASGHLMIGVVDVNDSKFVGRRLLNIHGYRTGLLFSSYLKQTSTLGIFWVEGNKSRTIYFPLDKYSDFHHFLNYHGIFLQVSGRSQKIAADALFAFSIADAEISEVPYTSGWYYTEKGKWKFSGSGDFTVKESIYGK